MKLLGISGRQGAGKDSAYKYLKKCAPRVCSKPPLVLRFGLADPIKETLIRLLDVPRQLAYGDLRDKERLLPHSSEFTIRDAAKTVGQALASLEPTVFVRLLFRELAALRDGPVIAVVTDVRKPIEVEAVQTYGGKVIRLTRDPNRDTHETETALDNYHGFDAVVDNKWLSEDLANSSVMSWLISWGWINADLY